MSLLLHAVLVATAVASPTPSPSPSPNPCAGLLAELNRPTIGYSPCVAQPGTAVFELGYQHQHNADASSHDQIGQGFLRFGLASRVEADVIGPSDLVRHASGGSAYGLADFGLGFKYELDATQRWQIALDGLYTEPNGARAFTSGDSTFTANVDAAYQATPSLSFASTLAFGASGGFGATGEHARYGVFMPSVLALYQFDDRTQAYAEYVNVSRTAPDLGDSSFLDVGLQRLVHRTIELDVEYGHSLDGTTSQRFNYVGAGVGILVR
ncbi:MAG: hypothetical protein ACREMP_09745 [Candidatus Tyrphobacter sp.]